MDLCGNVYRIATMSLNMNTVQGYLSMIIRYYEFFSFSVVMVYYRYDFENHHHAQVDAEACAVIGMRVLKKV